MIGKAFAGFAAALTIALTATIGRGGPDGVGGGAACGVDGRLGV